MKFLSERERASKTVADLRRYPEPDEIDPDVEREYVPTKQQIADRAFTLWNARGCPEGTAESDWLQAEMELRHEIHARNLALHR